MSVEKFISPNSNFESTLAVLTPQTDRGVMFRNFALEFCHAFGVQVGMLCTHKSEEATAARAENGSLRVFTRTGLPIGRISLNRDHNGDFYAYNSPYISKSKASARADKHTRESSKVSSLIQSIKRNEEQPRDSFFLATHGHGLRCALEATKSGRRFFQFHFEDALLLELVKNYLGEPSGILGYHDSIKEKYDEHLKLMREQEEKMLTHRRFSKGFRAVGIYNEGSHVYKNIYILANGAVDDSGSAVLTDLRTTMDFDRESDLSAIAMMSRTFFSGRADFANDNPFGIPTTDRYIPELDLAIGYAAHQLVWVMIPNHAE